MQTVPEDNQGHFSSKRKVGANRHNHAMDALPHKDCSLENVSSSHRKPVKAVYYTVSVSRAHVTEEIVDHAWQRANSRTANSRTSLRRE